MPFDVHVTRHSLQRNTIKYQLAVRLDSGLLVLLKAISPTKISASPVYCNEKRKYIDKRIAGKVQAAANHGTVED